MFEKDRRVQIGYLTTHRHRSGDHPHCCCFIQFRSAKTLQFIKIICITLSVQGVLRKVFYCGFRICKMHKKRALCANSSEYNIPLARLGNEHIGSALEISMLRNTRMNLKPNECIHESNLFSIATE